MAIWEDILPYLTKGAKLIRKRRAEPAWELILAGEVICPVYNNTVIALYSRGLVRYVLEEDADHIKAIYQGSICFGE